MTTTESQPAIKISCRYSGADWVREMCHFHHKPAPSPLGLAVADLLGELFRGIYHLNSTSLGKVKWWNERWIEVVCHGQMATFDNDDLTRFVILCHDRCIRGAIEGAAPRYLRLLFSPRLRAGGLFGRHPTMEQALALFRKRDVQP